MMFCCSMCMPIGWEGLSMLNDGCSVCMPIIIVNSKLRGGLVVKPSLALLVWL